MKARTLYSLIFSLAVILIICGLICIYSSSSIYALTMTGSAHYYFFKQLQGIAIALICGSIAARIPSHTLKKWSPALFVCALFLTALTLVPGFSLNLNGSRRWLNLGVLAFQPSELLKMSFILYTAYLCAKKQFDLSSLTKGFIPLLVIITICGGVLLAQPDFGQALTIALTGTSIYFLALGSLSYVGTIAAVGLPLITLLIALKPYRLKRVLTFLDPWKDPQGAGFQIIQSLTAIGTGHIFGTGLGQSKQKFFYLPMLHTDFIFSIIAEETGFIGTFLILSLYLLLIMGGLKLALSTQEPYAFLVISGFFILLALETIINLGVVTALLPTKGLGLPFMSYGKSSLIAHCTMLGVIYSLVKDT